MSRTRVIYSLLFAVIFLILLLIIIYFLINGRIFADSPYGTEMSRLDRSFDLNSDGKVETVSVVRYKNNAKDNFILSVVDKGGKIYSFNLVGFESEVTFCKANELIANLQDKIICLRGYVGVHSENIQLVTFNGRSLLPIDFSNDGLEVDRITSDAPNFGFKDLNNDNMVEMYVDNRDYEKDPTLDILRSYY